MAESMKCPVCNHDGIQIFCNTILNKYEISYYQCPHCKLIYTETPYWLDEAYKDAIVGTDTGLMQRNISFCVTVNTLIRQFYPTGQRFLDYGGGYGIFVRMMRDVGHRFQWTDKYSDNLATKGFEYQGGTVDLVTAFELFEHFDKPIQEVENLLGYSKNILVSTTVYGEEQGYPDKSWWYYAPHAGQHVVFYHRKTFEYLAGKYHLNYYQINSTLHLLTEQKLPGGRFNLIMKSKAGKVYQYLRWFIDRKDSLSEEDSNSVLEIKR